METIDDLPDLDRPPTYSSTDPIHPTLSVNHLPSPDVTFATLSPTAGHSYDLVLSTSGLQIKSASNVLYYVGRYWSSSSNDLVLYAGYDAHGPQLARADFVAGSKDIRFYVGGLKAPTGDDWDVARCASDGKLFHPSFYRFEAPGWEDGGVDQGRGRTRRRRFCWVKTHEAKLGASKLSSRDYKCVDEETEEVVAVYTEPLMGAAGKGTCRFLRKTNVGFEVAGLVVLLGVLEKSRRTLQGASRAFPSPAY